MKNKLLELREKLQTSIWFIPVLLCISSLALAFLLYWAERELAVALPQLETVTLSVTSARHVLGVIAGSVLSVGGVVFSVTMVALTLTSGQYGPKILRQFFSDRASKISLGMFLGTSLYCLVIMASYADTDEPGITVVAALVLTILALVSFVSFIHRTATELQADQIIERIGNELHHSLRYLTSEDNRRGRTDATLDWRRRARGKRPEVVVARKTGYVQTIDYRAVLQWCVTHDCVALVRVRAGDFLLQGSCLIKLYGCSQEQLEAGLGALCATIRTGPLRTPVQDPEYPVTQLNQLAARALSPGINDPGTAITCIDWFSMALAKIVNSELPGKVFLDDNSGARVLVRFTDFPGLAKAFYAPARQFASANIPVLIALLESLIRLAELSTWPDRLQQISTEGSALRDTIEHGDHLDPELNGFRQRYNKLTRLTTRLNP
jgi:uncharacterized membrane protein